MAKSNTKHRVCSGSSSVSSLLAHCSLSGSVFSNADGSFRFKDKLYSSASEALQAYIDDFDLSRIHPSPSTGKVNKGPVNVPRFSSYMNKPNNAFENLDHRQHSHSLCYRRGTVNDMDSISLTTDDLLRLPADGSFSFTHVRPGHRPTKRMKKKYFRRLDSLDIKKNSNFHISSTPMSKDNLVTHDVYTIINGKKRGWPRIPELMNRNNKCALSVLKESSFKDSSEHNPDKNYPRWLTSQKSDLNVSGVTSIPDFKYPIWLHNKDLLPDTDSQRVYKLFKEDEYSPIHSYQTQRTSQLTNKVDCFEHTFEPSNFTDSFSEDKGLVNEYKCVSEHTQCQCENPLLPGKSQKPFNGDKIELLILKAKENLKPQCTEDFPKPVTKDDSPCSLDKLEAERSWENVPVTFKSPVPVNADDSPQQSSGEMCVKEVLEDFLNNDNQSSTLSGGKHHGPVEALKQMLFNLQAVQESFNQNKTTETKEINQVLEDDFSKLQLKENMIPITTSLQKALQHLSHLRDLVDDTSGKQSPKM